MGFFRWKFITDEISEELWSEPRYQISEQLITGNEYHVHFFMSKIKLWSWTKFRVNSMTRFQHILQSLVSQGKETGSDFDNPENPYAGWEKNREQTSILVRSLALPFTSTTVTKANVSSSQQKCRTYPYFNSFAVLYFRRICMKNLCYNN